MAFPMCVASEVLDEWLLLGIVRAGAERFIRKLMADEREEVQRLRKWVPPARLMSFQVVLVALHALNVFFDGVY